MTIIMGDAKRKLSQQSCQLADQIPVHDLLYADDTLLIDVYGHNIQKYMDAVIEIGGQYGLLINWKKVDILAIKYETTIYDNEGNDVDNKQSINYLGSLLHMDAKIGSNNYASFLDQNSIGFYFYPGEQRMILFPAYRAFTKIHSPNTTDEVKYKLKLLIN